MPPPLPLARLGRTARHVEPRRRGLEALASRASATTTPIPEPVISAEMREFWEAHGWLRVPSAVPQANLDAVTRDIFDYIDGSRDDPESW